MGSDMLTPSGNGGAADTRCSWMFSLQFLSCSRDDIGLVPHKLLLGLRVHLEYLLVEDGLTPGQATGR